MQHLTLSRNVFGALIGPMLLVGCGGSQPPIGAPGAMPQSRAIVTRANRSTYKVVYSFGPLPDGHDPTGLVDVGGTLYGTTVGGGSYPGPCKYYYPSGCGTVYSITTGGTEKVLHSFGYGDDGTSPVASLIAVKGTLYGTTYEGGANPDCSQYYTGCGTVFSITRRGSEKVLHSFFYANGVEPETSLVDVKGKLYGTTSTGGANVCGQDYPGEGCGTVFSITTSGTEKVLHSFNFKGDGYDPASGLIDVGGALYGTTSKGKARRFGTVFRITRGGREKVLHTFDGGPDGKYPMASLIDVDGTLYGTTQNGGAYNGGTVFSITTSGTEKVLHSFGYGTDGVGPIAPLIDVNGTLYGTTYAGGASSFCVGGCGTVFSITTKGAEEVLYSFHGDGGGIYPSAGLTEVNGMLYGTTTSGGAYQYGTLFALTP
jgi:uncharacterized repeat protein (TIGR03803 family)